jgi:hypothetical protein
MSRQFLKIVFFLFCVFSISIEAQNYSGKKHMKVFDGDFNGGIMYSYNGIIFSVSIEEYHEDGFGHKAKPCKGNSDSNYDGVVPKYYYLKVTVENRAIYKVYFDNVPAVTLYLEDFNNPSPFSQCNNSTSSSLSVSFDVRSMGADSKMIFNDISQGDWFFGKPTISKYSTSSYVIENPNIKRWPIYPGVNYLEYAKQRGYSISKSNKKKEKKEKSKMDDFVDDLNNDINRTTTKKDIVKEHAQNNVKNKSKKVNSKNKPKVTKSNNLKNKKIYNETICRDLKLKATSYSRQMLKLLNSFNVNADVKNVMSQSNVLSHSIKIFSDTFIKAIEEDKVSPKCIKDINTLNNRYAKQYENAVSNMYRKLKY